MFIVGRVWTQTWKLLSNYYSHICHCTCTESHSENTKAPHVITRGNDLLLFQHYKTIPVVVKGALGKLFVSQVHGVSGQPQVLVSVNKLHVLLSKQPSSSMCTVKAAIIACRATVFTVEWLF